MCLIGQSSQARVDVDADGYRVEQRTETEQCSQTEDVRQLEDGHATEKRRRQVKEVRLEEVKSRESGPRPATLEEMRALLGAEFSGGAATEIQTSHEITVEEFTRVERKHEKIEGGTGRTQTETTTTEGKRTEVISEQPQWKMKAESGQEAEAAGQLMSLPIISADAQGSLDVSSPQTTVEVVAPSVTASAEVPAKTPKAKAGGIFGKFKLRPRGKGAEEERQPDAQAAAGGLVSADTGELSSEPMDISAEVLTSPSTEWTSEHHRVKHKRHVIEEVVIEDSDKFYEEIHKRPKLFIREKDKPDKENIEPVVERRRSTGEVPVFHAAQSAAPSNISSEELLRFVVEYDLAGSKLDEKTPEGRKRWTMPISLTGKSDETPDVSGEATEEKKRRPGDKQEEVVVEDEDLFTDTSLERKGFRFRKKKAGPMDEPQSETVTFIVHRDQPGSYVKVEPQMEVEEGGLNTDEKSGVHGSIEFPKWKLFERKQKTPSTENVKTSSPKIDAKKLIPHMHIRSKYAKFGKLCAKGDTVTYHSAEATLPKDTSVHETKWPPLNVHFGGKYVTATDVSTGEVKADTETYVIELIEQLPCDSDPDKMDTGVCVPELQFILNNRLPDSPEGQDYVIYRVDHPMDTGVSADDKSTDRMQWPDLKLICTTPSDDKGETSEAVMPVYVVCQIIPLSNVTPGTDSPQDVKVPNVQLHFVSSGNVTEEQKITFIVEHPDRPASVVDGQSGSKFELPKFRPHFGTWPLKHGGAVSPVLLTRIDELPGEVHSDSGAMWPKLNFHFDREPAKDGSQISGDKEVVSYVVESPTPGVSTVHSSNIQWPTVGLDFSTKTATVIDAKNYSEKTLTYIAESASPKGSGDKEVQTVQRLPWPNFNIHFESKPNQRHGDETGPVSYSFVQPVAVNLLKADSSRGGIDWPKFGTHIRSKFPQQRASDSSQELQTVTYIVEEPAPETEGKGLQIVWPKVDFRLGERKKAQEIVQDVEPEVVIYIIEQPLPAQGDSVDGKRRFRIEWPKFSSQIGSKQTKPEDVFTDTERAYIVQEIVPEPAADESKPEIHWPKLRIRFGAKSDDKHPSMDEIDETVTYVVEQPSPIIERRTGIGIHLTKPGLHGAGKSVAEEQTVTYVVESPARTDISSDRQRHFHVKLPKLNVHFGLKKVKYGEGNGDASGEIVTYVVEQIVPVDRGSDRRGIDWPTLRWQPGRRNKDAVTSEETVTYIVEAPAPPEGEKSGIGVSMPKLDLPFGKTSRKHEDEMDTEADKTPYVLQQEMQVKTKLQMEWPKFKHPHFKGKAAVGDDGAAYVVDEINPVQTELSDGSSVIKGIRWPKLTVKFRSKTLGTAGARETSTVTYVIEQQSAERNNTSELGWPQLNLNFSEKIDKRAAGPQQTVNYVVELLEEPPDDTVEGKGKATLNWPTLTVHYGLKSVEHDTAGVDGECVKVTYAVQRIVPIPQEGDEKRVSGGIEWPKLHWQFGGKTSDKDDSEGTEAETVTYIVEAPAPSEAAKRGFGISVPKPNIDFRFRKKTKKHDDEMETESDNAPYVLEQEVPVESGSGDVKRRLHIEWPKFKFPRFKGKAAVQGDAETAHIVEEVFAVPPDDDHDGSATGGIRWPKLNVRFASKSQGAEVETETKTVTYVVEQPPSGGFHWPKLNLHLGKTAGDAREVTPETVSYVVEQPADTMTVAGEEKGELDVSWPKLKVHFGLKSAQRGAPAVDRGDETVTYVVQQIIPDPHEVPDKKTGSRIEWPKLHWQFGRKTSGKEDVESEGSETVTYIVEAPAPSEEAKRGFGISVPKPNIDFRFRKKTKKHDDDMETESDNAPYVLEQEVPAESGSGDVKRRLHIEWPKFKFPRFKGKAAVQGDAETAYVVEEVCAVPPEDGHNGSAAGGIRWPKLNVRFASKSQGAEGETETKTVTYVVEQPPAELSESGGFQWPKFNLHLGKTTGDAKEVTPETVTYVVEQPAEPMTVAGEEKGELDVSWPKLKVHFGLKSTDVDEKSEKVSYTVSHIVPVPPKDEDKKLGGGIEWPKFQWPFGTKTSDKPAVDHVDESETVTYIVDAPAPLEAEKSSFLISMPKPNIDFRFRKKTDKKHEGEVDTELGTVEYVMQHEIPDERGSGDDKTKLHIVWPKFKFPHAKRKAAVVRDGEAAYVVEEIAPVPTDDDRDGSATEEIRWPKLNVRFRNTTPRVEGKDETTTVTYVVERPSAELSETGGFRWPQLNLHVSGKTDEKTVDGTLQPLTYAAKESIASPTDAGNGKGRVEWPKLSVYFGLKPHAKDTDRKGGEVTYAVEHIVPVPREDDSKKVGSGIEWPKLSFHMSGKTSGKYVVNEAEDTETVTYIVEDHGPSLGGSSVPKVSKFDFKLGPRKKPELGIDMEQLSYVVEQPMPDVGGSVDAKTKLRIEWPKFKYNAVDTGYGVRDSDKDYIIIKEIIPVAVEDEDDGSTTGGIRWPKLNARFGSAKSADVSDADTYIAYVVDSNRTVWPEFNLTITGNAKHPLSTADQSVTYVVQQTAEPSPADVSLPKLKVHFGLKSVEPQDANDPDVGEAVTYAVTHIEPEPVRPHRGAPSFNIEWPKVKMFRGKKAADIQQKEPSTEETVTYIVEQPADVQRVDDHKGGFSMSFPKLGGKVGRTDSDRDEDARPKDSETGDVCRSKGGSWFGGSFTLGKLSLTKKGDLPNAAKETEDQLNVTPSDSSFGVDRESGMLITSTPKRTADVSSPSSDTEASSSFRMSGVTNLFGGGGVGIDVEVQPMVVRSTAAAPTMSSPAGSSSADVDGRTPSPPGAVPSRAVTARGSPLPPWQTPHFVIVAIDFGTAFSGYAFCFPQDVSAATSAGEPLPSIHVMRKWEGGDPGAVDMKTPTILLLTPEGEFHSFGFTARDFYHDLSPSEARRWLYFDKFKMALHYNTVRWYFLYVVT